MTKVAPIQIAPEEYKKRLQEIAELSFGTLSDDEILHFLAERKKLTLLEQEYEQAKEAEALRLEQEKKEAAEKAFAKKKAVIVKKIEALNATISPDKPDDELLRLVAERQELEAALEALRPEAKAADQTPAVPVVSIEEASRKAAPEEAALAKEIPEEKKVSAEEGKAIVSEPVVSEAKAATVDEGIGNEKIEGNGMAMNSQFVRYLDQLKSNSGSLGELLQSLPLDVKKNKAFMLKVAEIDPAYAMHYADKETLKRDEDFNVRIASMGNPRNSGNALSEMLPEARTSKVLLAAVRKDYRNIKFIQPTMADYDALLDIAKAGALDKVKSLKEAADILLLIPKILQQDKKFMAQVESTGATK
jgi:hypothetical protein